MDDAGEGHRLRRGRRRGRRGTVSAVNRIAFVMVSAWLAASCDGRPLRTWVMSDTTAPASVQLDAGYGDATRDAIPVAEALAKADPMQCDQLVRMAEDQFWASVTNAKASSQCQVASDCQPAPQLACSLFCATDVLPQAGVALVEATIAAMNADVCQQFKTMGCEPPALVCAVPIGVVACVHGGCTTVLPPSSKLPSPGGDDPDFPTAHL